MKVRDWISRSLYRSKRRSLLPGLKGHRIVYAVLNVMTNDWTTVKVILASHVPYMCTMSCTLRIIN